MSLFKKLGRTARGETPLGKTLHQVLPFKKARSVAGEVLKGAADIAPVPNAKSAKIIAKANTVKDKLGDIKEKNTKAEILELVKDAYDLLDDGQLNDSADLNPETRRKIRLVSSVLFFGIVVYEVIAIFTG